MNILLHAPACQPQAAALADSPRAQRAIIGFIASRGLPALVAGFLAGCEPDVAVECATIKVLANILQHASLEQALARQLCSPGGAAVVRLAGQLCSKVPPSQPAGWNREHYLGLHADTLGLCCLLAAAMHDRPGAADRSAAQHAALRTEQLAAARELVHTLPQLARSLQALTSAGTQPDQLLIMYAQLGDALSLLLRVHSAVLGAADIQLSITSQADIDDWLAACEAAARLVHMAAQLRQRLSAAPTALGAATDGSIAVLDKAVGALLLNVWFQGTQLMIRTEQQPAMLKRIWWLHLCGCRVLHATLAQLPATGLQALIEGLHCLVAAAQCPETDDGGDR